jgi:hypothetical protein
VEPSVGSVWRKTAMLCRCCARQENSGLTWLPRLDSNLTNRIYVTACVAVD